MSNKPSAAFVGASWIALGVGAIGYAFAFLLAIFGAVAVQKNTRDTLASERSNKPEKKHPS